MTLMVDGHDIRRFVQFDQYTVRREDLDGPNAGRTLDGVMHRDYLGGKRNVEVQLVPLTNADWGFLEHTVLRGRPWNQVTFEDFGVTATMKAYHSSFNGVYNSGTARWHGGRLKFIEE